MSAPQDNPKPGNQIFPHDDRGNFTKFLFEISASAGEWFWETDHKGIITHSNAAVENILGFTPEEIAGKKIYNLLFIENDDAPRIHFLETIRNHGIFKQLRSRCRGRDGQEVHMEISGAPVISADGVFQGYMGICRDISIQVMSELVWETAGLIFNMFINADTRESLYENIPRLLCRRFGFSAATLEFYDREKGEMISYGLGQPGADPIRIPIDQTISGMVATTGVPIVESDALNSEKYAATSLSSLKVNSFVCVPIKIRDNVLGVISIGDYRKRKVTDIFVYALQMIASHLAQVIERKNAEERLAEKESQYKLLMEQAVDGIFISDGEGKYLESNSAGLAMLGYSLDEIRGMTIYDVIPPEDLETNPLQIEELKRGKSILNERRLIRGDGKIIPVEISARILSNGNLLGIIRDITDRKMAETRVQNIARFPEENPSPVLRILNGGLISYANDASRPLLKAWGRQVFDFAPNQIISICERAKEDGKILEFEENCAGRIFSAHVTPVKGQSYVNIYGRDITDRKMAENALRSERNFVSAILDTASALVVVLDRDGKMVRVNRACSELSGYVPNELLGKNIWDFLAPTEDMDALKELFHELITKKIPKQHENFWITKSGKRRLMTWENSVITNDRGEVEFMVGVGVDITIRREAEYEVRLAAKVFENIFDGVMITDPDSRILKVNDSFTRITGYKAEEVIGKKPSILKSSRHDRAFYEAMWKSILSTGQWRGEIWNRRRNGEIYPQWMTISAITDNTGETLHYVSVFQDITEIKQYEEEIKYQAYHDALTGLPNRILLIDYLRRSVTRAKREWRKTAVLFVDLDGFKNVNDTFGHDVGDMLLQGVAIRLVGSLREEDTVARLGGDEFLVLIEHAPHEQGLRLIAEKILEAVREPFDLRSREIVIGASVGVAQYPIDSGDPEELIKRADAAMYCAKEKGKNTYRLFNECEYDNEEGDGG